MQVLSFCGSALSAGQYSMVNDWAGNRADLYRLRKSGRFYHQWNYRFPGVSSLTQNRLQTPCFHKGRVLLSKWVLSLRSNLALLASGFPEFHF